jgi:hypothetical protein
MRAVGAFVFDPDASVESTDARRDGAGEVVGALHLPGDLPLFVQSRGESAPSIRLPVTAVRIAPRTPRVLARADGVPAPHSSEDPH